MIISVKEDQKLEIQKLFSIVLLEAKVVVKGSRRDRSLAKFTTPCPSVAAGWNVSINEGSYLRFDFRKSESLFEWKHCEENIREWAKTCDYDPKTRTARTVAKMVDILLWDCKLSGDAPYPFSSVSSPSYQKSEKAYLPAQIGMNKPT